MTTDVDAPPMRTATQERLKRGTWGQLELNALADQLETAPLTQYGGALAAQILEAVGHEVQRQGSTWSWEMRHKNNRGVWIPMASPLFHMQNAIETLPLRWTYMVDARGKRAHAHAQRILAPGRIITTEGTAATPQAALCVAALRAYAVLLPRRVK